MGHLAWSTSEGFSPDIVQALNAPDNENHNFPKEPNLPCLYAKYKSEYIFQKRLLGRNKIWRQYGSLKQELVSHTKLNWNEFPEKMKHTEENKLLTRTHSF